MFRCHKKIFLILFFLSVIIQAQVISRNGLELIKYYEGFRGKAYLCPAGVLTIGYGSTGSHVSVGMQINKQEAENLLKKDVKRFEDHIKKNTTRILKQNEFDALTSFTFNVGYRIKDELRMFVNQGNTNGVVSKLMLYNKAKVNGVYIVLKGLTKRRLSETTLYKDAILVF